MGSVGLREFHETSAEVDTDSQSISSGVNTGPAPDGYVDNDVGTVTVTDSTTTTTFDSYIMYDVHYISGSEAGSSSYSGLSYKWSDVGVNHDTIITSVSCYEAGRDER